MKGPSEPNQNQNPSGIGWPLQDGVGYIPAVRNRNPSSQGVIAAGRGFGMPREGFAYADFNVATQEGTPPAIIHVTNTNTDGAGSLKEALVDTAGPRIIVFDVGGLIQLSAGDNWNCSNGKVWLAGQTAPELVVIDVMGENLNIRSEGQFWQHIFVWHSGGLGDGAEAALTIGQSIPVSADYNNVVNDHCFFGGGTDQTWSTNQDVHQCTLIDSMVALPRLSVTANHAFIASIGGNSATEDSDFISLVGTIMAFGQQRSPQVRSTNFAICNHLVYDREVYGFRVGGKNAPETFKCNCLGLYEKRGADHKLAAKPIQLSASGSSLKFAVDSEFYFNDTRAVEYSTDEWDVVDDPENQEGDIRSNTLVTAAWPTGLVAAPNRAVSEADYVTLMTQNNGPRPNERVQFLQDIYDDIINGTGSIQNEYTLPTFPSTTRVYVPPANPHGAGTDPNRSRIEEDLLDMSEALLV